MNNNTNFARDFLSLYDEHEDAEWSVDFQAMADRARALIAAPELCRFGHHQNPAIDFEIEVESLVGRLFNARHGIVKVGDPIETVDTVILAIERAMTFNVGGDESAVRAKQVLRALEDEAALYNKDGLRLITASDSVARDCPDALRDRLIELFYRERSREDDAVLADGVIALLDAPAARDVIGACGAKQPEAAHGEQGDGAAFAGREELREALIGLLYRQRMNEDDAALADSVIGLIDQREVLTQPVPAAPGAVDASRLDLVERERFGFTPIAGGGWDVMAFDDEGDDKGVVLGSAVSLRAAIDEAAALAQPDGARMGGEDQS